MRNKNIIKNSKCNMINYINNYKNLFFEYVILHLFRNFYCLLSKNIISYNNRIIRTALCLNCIQKETEILKFQKTLTVSKIYKILFIY